MPLGACHVGDALTKADGAEASGLWDWYPRLERIHMICSLLLEALVRQPVDKVDDLLPDEGARAEKKAKSPLLQGEATCDVVRGVVDEDCRVMVEQVVPLPLAVV